MRADLLAIAAQDMESRLRPMLSFPGSSDQVDVSLPKSRRAAAGGLALDIGKRYGVYGE